MAGSTAAPYSSGSYDYDALLTETPDLVKSYLAIQDMAEWRRHHQADERLQKSFRGKVDHLLDIMARRYLMDQDKGFRETPLLILLGGRLPDAFSRHLYFLHYCLAERLAYEVVTEVVAPKQFGGDSGVSKKAVDSFLERQSPRHPEVLQWSPTIRDRIVSSILGALREFGMLGGQSGHEFQPLPPPVELFAYLLYWLRDKRTKQWLQHKHWRLLLMREAEVLEYLRRSDAEGYVLFDPAAADLEYTCGNLLELAAELVKAQAPRRG